MWRVGAKLAAVAALIGGGAASVAISSSDDLSTAFKICTVVPARLLRDAFTAATIAFDYEYSMRGLKDGSIEWSKAKHEVHNRCAYRLRELCFRNGGIYIKLGQHLGQLIFEEFNPEPLASASLAQVHAARTHDGKNVAVKIQHTHLTDTAIADIATVKLLVNGLNWCFPEFDYSRRSNRCIVSSEASRGPRCFYDAPSRTSQRPKPSPATTSPDAVDSASQSRQPPAPVAPGVLSTSVSYFGTPLYRSTCRLESGTSKSGSFPARPI
ncbi:putative ABC1 protein [Platanthera zijinensis]|uniref:ABC1 protein n=1 Tax=Platanthera zijinensis TaxID=2320716 RepID=A0AAP0GBM2_9ASPA